MNAVRAILDANPEADQMSEATVADLKAAQEKLTQSAQKVFAKMYEQSQAAQQGAGPDMSNMGGFNGGANTSSTPDDDVIDADFKEV